MSRPRTAQELVHWLEAGAGAGWIRLAAFLAGTLALSLVVAWKQFHGPVTESTLLQADMGRQLARGEGFTTLVNFPQTVAFLQARGEKFDAATPYPELHHAPLYALVVAGGLRLFPEAAREKLFASAPVPPDGFAADYFLLGLNVALLWLAAWLSYYLGRRLFEARVGWLAALAMLLSMPVWQQTVAVGGTTLLMVLALVVFSVWHRAESATARVPWVWLGLLGMSCGLLFLAEYSAGAVGLVALAYAAVRFPSGGRWAAAGVVAAGFLLVAGPWIARNVIVSGSPVALALQNVALKAGDSTAEPATVRSALSAELARIDLNKLGNKTLTALQASLRERLWSGGAMWLTAFFFVGTLYAFRSPVVNRLRWVFCTALVVSLIAQAALNSGESDRYVAAWMAPLIMVFGAGFFFILLGSNATLAHWPRASMAGLLIVQALPLVHDVLEPRRLHFHYPPYHPGLLLSRPRELVQRGADGRFGLMADVPAAMAWYGGGRVWAQPQRLRDFYGVTFVQPIGELLLTPSTLDRPFFTELNAKPLLEESVIRTKRFDEWGEIYAGLLTGRFPAEFPLPQPIKVMENLYLLVNPALPPLRGK